MKYICLLWKKKGKIPAKHTLILFEEISKELILNHSEMFVIWWQIRSLGSSNHTQQFGILRWLWNLCRCFLSIECRIFSFILAFSFSLHTSCSKCFLMSHFWFFIKCDLFIYFSLSVTLCILLDSYIIIIIDLLCLVCLSVATFSGMVYLIHVLVCKSLPLIFNQLMNFLKKLNWALSYKLGSILHPYLRKRCHFFLLQPHFIVCFPQMLILLLLLDSYYLLDVYISCLLQSQTAVDNIFNYTHMRTFGDLHGDFDESFFFQSCVYVPRFYSSGVYDSFSSTFILYTSIVVHE